MIDPSGKYSENEPTKGEGMNLAAKIILISAVALLPAALWLGGSWWKWVLTGLALVIAAAIADQDPK